jgi:SAM-dependent methyltransferase
MKKLASSKRRSVLTRAVYKIMRIVDPLLPVEVRLQGPRYFVHYLRDLRDELSGKTEPGVPPRRLNISGGGSFRALGEHNLLLCRTYGQLQPNDVVLDIGCGIGRTALPLTRFLAPPGRYTGIDVIDFAIRWCQKEIGREYPHFRFLHADVYNKHYNRRGKINPDQYSFPLASDSITFCLATSVFTHLLPATTERYIREIARVLRPGGRFFSTWFLLDETTETRAAEGKAQFDFQFRFANHAQVSRDAPETAVAYRLDYLKDILAEAGLEIASVQHGGWSGALDRIDSGQDVIVCRGGYPL